jgi:hypothetical protein
VGGGILFATGTIGSKSSTVKIELPKVTTVNNFAYAVAGGWARLAREITEQRQVLLAHVLLHEHFERRLEDENRAISGSGRTCLTVMAASGGLAAFQIASLNHAPRGAFSPF